MSLAHSPFNMLVSTAVFLNQVTLKVSMCSAKSSKEEKNKCF